MKSDKCHQNTNLNEVKVNVNESMFYQKTEVLAKSKIPCKINDKSVSESFKFNNTLLSLSDSVKQNKTKPRLIGTLVLSDFLNRKFPEISSKLKK